MPRPSKPPLIGTSVVSSCRSTLRWMILLFWFCFWGGGEKSGGVNGFVITSPIGHNSGSTNRIRRFQVGQPLVVEETDDRQQSTAITTLKQRTDAISKRIIPPISEQEKDNKTILGSFHPNFIIKEFGFGFQYMWNVMIIFWTASRIFDLFRVGLPLPSGTFVLNTHLLTTPLAPLLAVLDNACIKILGEEICCTSQPLWYVTAISPFMEEVTFRGIGIFLFQSTFQLGLLCLAYVCHVSVYLGYATLAGILILAGTYATTLLTSLRGSQPILTCWTALIHLMAQLIICIGPALALLDITRKPKTSDYNDNNSNASYYTRVVLGLATGRSYLTTAKPFERLQKKSMNLHARLATSLDFGLCHVKADCVSLAEAMMDFQKAFGSFVSSLLVESRLGIQRHNIWAPFGAHVAWNLITSLLSYKSFLILYGLIQLVVIRSGLRKESAAAAAVNHLPRAESQANTKSNIE